MKKYEWDLNELNKKRKLIIEEVKTRKSKNEKLSEEEAIKYILCLLSLNEMLNINNPSKFPFLKYNKKKLLEKIQFIINNYSTYYQRRIIKLNSDYMKDLYYIDDDFNNYELPFEKQIELINNFFKDDPVSKTINDVLNPDKHLLNINKKNKNTFYSDFFGNYYIENHNKELSHNFLLLCHELGHLIENKKTNKRLDKLIILDKVTSLKSYNEVFSLFYELISIDLLLENKVITNEDALKHYSYIHAVNCSDIDTFLIADYISRKNYLTNIDYLEFKFSKSSIIYEGMYFYSYLIAASLYEIYLEDKEKALYNIEYLINNITPENEKKLLIQNDIDLENPEYLHKHLNKIKRNN